MKQLTILCYLLCSINYCHGATYTFHTEGSYLNESNWDVYPGTELSAGDTISIEADCNNIYLQAFDGYVVFSDAVGWIGIGDLYIFEDCTLEFQSEWLWLDIYGTFEYYNYNEINHPNNLYVEILNFGFGINANGCLFDYSADISYNNIGTQASDLLECMNGSITNDGIIEVNSSYFFLGCHLELSGGTINSYVPFEMYTYGGLVSQYCTTCTATINNVISLNLSGNTMIQGNVILNSP